jgi:hypothetical protein
MLPETPRQNACARAWRSDHKNRLVYLILHFSVVVARRLLASSSGSLAQYDSSYMSRQFSHPNGGGLSMAGAPVVWH